MPKPKAGESKDEYISRCIPIVMDEGRAESNDQAVAICNSMWEDEHKASEMIRAYHVGEFRGDFPAIPVDDRVDVEALTKGDADPFFVTLPIARIGEASANGLMYDEELVGVIEQELIGKGGILGHLKPEERDTAFPVEDVDWVGVQRIEDTTWAKGYLPPGEAREFVRRLMARRGKLATSIYGAYAEREPLEGGGWRARGFRLEQLDLAPADRAALQLGGQFAVTAQMTNDQHSEEEVEMDREGIIAELTPGDLPQAIRDQIVQEWQTQHDVDAKLAELEQARDAEKDRADQLTGRLAEYELHEFEARLDGKIAELIDWKVKGEEAEKKVKALKGTVRARILSELRDERDEVKLAETITAMWDEMKPLAETVRDALAGPSARVSGKVRDSRKIEDTPETRAQARGNVGI